MASMGLPHPWNVKGTDKHARRHRHMQDTERFVCADVAYQREESLGMLQEVFIKLLLPSQSQQYIIN